MGRGGQVFYLYNRVETIEQKVEEIQELVPEARIGYAHGQMTEAQLENTLFEFIEGQYDVLVTTTIIETGVDIPNANTLFVENADYMGLSTLYQLRGRVGRAAVSHMLTLCMSSRRSLTKSVKNVFRQSKILQNWIWIQDCDAGSFHLRCR